MAWKPDYVTLDDLKRHLRIPGNFEGSLNTNEDDFDNIPLSMAITAASRAVDLATNRQFGYCTDRETFIYTPEWDSKLQKYVVYIDDLMDTADLVVTFLGATELDDDVDSDVDSNYWNLQPRNNPIKGLPWTKIVFESVVSPPMREGSVEVDAHFGWTDIPTAIKQATLLQAARFFKRRDAAFGVTGSPELGSELRLLNKVDPDVEVALRPYKRWWGAK